MMQISSKSNDIFNQKYFTLVAGLIYPNFLNHQKKHLVWFILNIHLHVYNQFPV